MSERFEIYLADGKDLLPDGGYRLKITDPNGNGNHKLRLDDEELAELHEVICQRLYPPGQPSRLTELKLAAHELLRNGFSSLSFSQRVAAISELDSIIEAASYSRPPS
jgi:hypothetical protein